jgi:hypothetical protein
MAIPILNHMDFQKSGEIRNVRLHNQASSGVTSPGTGQIIYDSGTIKVYNGTSSSWMSLGTGSGSGTVTSVTAGTGMTQSGTSTINPTLNVIGGNGMTANADDIEVTPAQTTITSIYNTGLAIGYGASHANIDFSTDNAIIFDIDGTQQVKIEDGGLLPITNNDVKLGSATYRWTNVAAVSGNYSGTVTAAAFSGPLTGNVTGNASGTALTVTQAAQTAITSLGTLTALTVDDVAIDGKVVTMTGSASDTATLTVGTNGTLDITTTDAAAAAANITITADGTFEAIGSTVTLDSGGAINLEPAAGSVILLDGTISVDAGVVTGATSITSTAFVGALTGNADTATLSTNSTHVYVADNENTNEENAITFVEGASKNSSGNVGLESDGDLTYNPSTGNLTATQLTGTLQTASQTNVTGVGTISTGTWQATDVGIAYGGTGASTAAAAATALLAVSQGGALTIGDGSDTITIPGDLTVTGTTTTNNVETVSTSNGVVFEGGTLDGHDGTLISVVAGADVTYTLPNVAGYVALFSADPSTTAISSTVAELNIMDGGTSATSTTVADADRVVYNDAGTMKQVAMTDLAAYFDDEITAMPNLVTVGTIGSGTWNGGVIASAYLDADTAHVAVAQTLTNKTLTSPDINGGTWNGTVDGNSTAAGITWADLGSVTTIDINGGTINGITDLAIADGGTGQSTALAAFTALKQAATTSATGVVELATDAEAKAGSGASKVVDATQLGARSVVATIDVSDSDFTSNLYAEITHSLGTEDVIVELFDSSSKETVYADVARTDKSNSASTSKVKISFSSAPSDDIEVIITQHQGAAAGSVAYA